MFICDACGARVVVSSDQVIKERHTWGNAKICGGCTALIRDRVEILQLQERPVNPLHIAKQLYRQSENIGGNFLLRDIPAKLWQDVKRLGVDDNKSLRTMVLEALYEYVEGKE